MAEFTEVMKQKQKMCESYNSCNNCPLIIDGLASLCFESSRLNNVTNAKVAEEIIMKWAKDKEHPELTNVDKIGGRMGIVNTLELEKEFNRLIDVAYDKGRVEGYNQARKEPAKED